MFSLLFAQYKSVVSHDFNDLLWKDRCIDSVVPTDVRFPVYSVQIF